MPTRPSSAADDDAPAAADGLPPLRAVIDSLGLAARKALGQNFLLDLNLTRRIARASPGISGGHILEIGPGPGGLTRALLAEGAASVVAIERDPRFLPALAAIADHYPGRLSVVEADACAVDHRTLMAAFDPARTAIVANLPYNIATPLIVGWLRSDPWPPWFHAITIMVQREFADRLVATPARPADYGRLSVLTGWRMEARRLFDVPAAAFVPRPKVTSSIVQLLPRAAPLPGAVAALEAVTAAAFGQRRKMLRQALRGLGSAEALLDTAGLAPEARAETITVEGFLRLARAYAALHPHVSARGGG